MSPRPKRSSGQSDGDHRLDARPPRVLPPGARGREVLEVVHDLPVVEAWIADVQVRRSLVPPARCHGSLTTPDGCKGSRSSAPCHRSLRTPRISIRAVQATAFRTLEGGDMRAFVTGGTGFIGGRVVRRLRERGDEVVALVRSPRRRERPGRARLRAGRGRPVLRPTRSGAAMQGCDAVFHIAAVYKVGHPGVRARRDARGERARAPSGCSTPRSRRT